MRFSFRTGIFPIIPTPRLKVQRFLFFYSECAPATCPQTGPQRSTVITYIPPNKDMHSTYTYIAYIVHTTNSITTYTHVLIHLCATHKQSHTKRICVVGALTYEARLVCVCARCLDFFFMAHTPCLHSTISHNITHYTYLAHIYIHIVGYTYATYLAYTHTHTGTHKPLYTHACACLRIIYTHLHTDSVLLCQPIPTHTEPLPTQHTPLHSCTHLLTQQSV